MNYSQTCPLCEANNNCQVNNSTKTCWCSAYTFTDSLKEKIRQLPLDCICATCAEKLGALKKTKVIHKYD